MGIFQVPKATQAVVDLMVSYIRNHHSNVDVIVGMYNPLNSLLVFLRSDSMRRGLDFSKIHN